MKVSREVEDRMHQNAITPVSADVEFASNGFPRYRIGADNKILVNVKLDGEGPSLKNVVAQESACLFEQQKRLSVRDLASKFDKNLAIAAKLSDEAKLKDVVSLEGHVLLKKLKDALESLRGCLDSQNKDVEKAIAMVNTLAVKLTQDEGELIQEKFEVKKLANLLKQTSEDAKKLVNQERSFACAEIESARAVVQRISEAIEEQEKRSLACGRQGVDELLEEVQEARRIRMLHQPRKVKDMEAELCALRVQVQDKLTLSIKLQRELEMIRRGEDYRSSVYKLDGLEALGSCLQILPCSDNAVDLSECSFQWYHLSFDGSKKEIISGASVSTYAPEPLDVGFLLQAEISSNERSFTLTTLGPIEHAEGLESYVETLLKKSNSEFKVTISQMNSRDYPSAALHVLHVGKTRMKLCRSWITKARECYTSSMKLCGARRGAAAATASKSVFWRAKGASYTLAFQSECERNTAIMLSRAYALDCNVILVGP